MSNETKIPNEDALWNELTTPAESAPKAASPKETKPETPAKPEKAAKSGRKIDGFFLGCMAGVAAVSVALTLLAGSLLGGGNTTPAASGAAGDSAQLQALQEENERLKSQLEVQQKTIIDLQNNLMEFMGTAEYLENAAANPSNPANTDDVLAKQTEAYEILSQIQNAYAEFDRDKLAELIPEMDARLEYLSADALNSYYLILEYMEQPSNG